jgi:hypothetical protein
MPFILRNLDRLGGGKSAASGVGEATSSIGNGAFTVWLYRTEDATATVDTSGYFNAAADLLRPGDWIMRTTVNSSGVPQTAGTHLVVSNAAGVVDVADTTALTVTDTD